MRLTARLVASVAWLVACSLLIFARRPQDIGNAPGPAVVLTTGTSGALHVSDGVLDIVPSVVPRLQSFNTFTGLNSFTYLRLVPNSSGQPRVCNEGQDALGLLWFDTSNPQTSHLKLCAMTAGKADWVQIR